MKPVFLDTVGLIALWEKADQWHHQATSAFALLLQQGRSLVTTPQVLLECGNAMARRPSRQDVIDLRHELIQIGALIVPTPQEEASAWLSYERGEAGNTGIVDHISFEVMKRLGLSDAFTCDRHFLIAGFNVLF